MNGNFTLAAKPIRRVLTAHTSRGDKCDFKDVCPRTEVDQ